MTDTPKRSGHPVLRIVLLVLGVLLILSTPIVGPIPGPGGIIVFAAGLTLVLRNSRWARRQFARAKRRWPRIGAYADRGLRRRSAQRRRERDERLGLCAPVPDWRTRAKRLFGRSDAPRDAERPR